jgi:hypothetical protein
MISSVRPDSLYDIKLTLNGAKPMKITALRQEAVDIVRQLATDPIFKENARILEIVRVNGDERYVGPAQAWLFVTNNDEADVSG